MSISSVRTKTWIKVQMGANVGCALLAMALSASGGALTAGDPILLEGTKGKFDFIRVDRDKHRLLLAHTGNKSLDVFDLDAKKLLKSVATGAAQDSATDKKHHRYYASISDPPRMAIVDSEKLEMTGEVPLPAASDLMAYDASSGRAYVCNDTAAEIWVIDPEAKKIVNTIKLEGKSMEELAVDGKAKRMFQVVSGLNSIVVIDPKDDKVLETWAVQPAVKPHGMVLVPDADTLLVAGGSGKLALMSRTSGKVLSTADTDNRVDEMAYDPELHLAYCPGGSGKIAVVSVEGEKLNKIEDVPGAAGRSVVVDPKTHIVWIASAKGEQAFVTPFTPGRQPGM